MLEVGEGTRRPAQLNSTEFESQEHALVDRRHLALVLVDRQLKSPGEKGSNAAFDALAYTWQCTGRAEQRRLPLLAAYRRAPDLHVSGQAGIALNYGLLRIEGSLYD